MPIVRRGSPVGRNVGPLQGMSFPTVEGKLRLGYHRGGRGNGIGLLLPIDPTVPIPNTVPRKATVHGIGAFTRGRGLGALVSIAVRNLTTGQSAGAQGSMSYGPNGVLVGPDYPPGSFKVGDRWQVTLSGLDPNGAAGVVTTFDGLALPMSGQQDLPASILLGRYIDGNAGWGKADASGTYTATGTFGPGQIGAWMLSQGGQGVLFTVTDANGNVTPYTGQTQPGGTPYYTLAQNNVPTQPAPAPVVQTLAQELAARGDTLAPTGQLVPVVTSTAAASGAPAAVGGGSAAGSISDLVSGFSLSSIPTWGWIAAAGVGALLLFGGDKHHG